MKLPFLDQGYDHGPVRDFWCLRDHDIPQRPGAYILLARPRITFMYPRRQSSVFYIGKAAHLRARLRQHLRYATEARDRRQRTLYWPRYEYAASFGARYTYVLAKSRKKPKRLEDELLAMFAEHYRSWPAANGVGAWGSLLTPAQLHRRSARA